MTFVFRLAAAGPAVYVGAESCRACHEANFASQSTTGHAHALSPSVSGQPGNWAFGAGLHAITFLTKIDRDSWREEGLSWYRSLNGYAITPGHHDQKGIVFRTFDPVARILTCFACHSTGPLSLGKEDQVLPHELGVRCEVCHGPASAHVSDPSRNPLPTPARLTAVAMNGFCGKCHRIDSESGEESTDLGDFRNARVQPLRLAASACFLRTNGRLNCLTCHSPHQPLNQNEASYDARCQSCHTNAVHQQPVAGKACVSCHMPRIPNGEYLSFTNHRIAVYASGNPVVPVTLPARH
jgi:hypothetical protein